MVVLLDSSRHAGAARLERISEGAAAVEVAQALLGSGRTDAGRARPEVAVRVLEALQGTAAWAASGTDPVAVAEALETLP